MPAAPRASAMPLPAPRLAPVTSATCGRYSLTANAAASGRARFSQVQEQRWLTATVHRKQCAAHVGSQRGRKVETGVGDVASLGESPQRKHGAEARNSGLTAVVLGGIFGGDKARNNAVDAHLGPPLHRQALRGVQQAGLGSAVG